MSDYVPIRLTTLRGQVAFKFNIYIPVQNKYILYVRSGDDIQQDRLSHLRKKKVRQLFIDSDDETHYQNYLDEGLNAAINDDKMTKDDKAGVVTGMASGAVDLMQKEPDSIAAYKMTEKAASGLCQVLSKDPEVLKHIFKRSAESDKADVRSRHGVNVASLSVALATAMRAKTQEISDIGVAGLLHDIGLDKIPVEKQALLCTPYDQFTKEDWDAYQQHPTLGADMLNNKEHINANILYLIKVHEERKSGQGFPKGLKKMNPLEESLALTCWYDRLVTCLGWTHKAAFENLKIDQLGNFDMGILNKFKSVLESQGVTTLD